MSHNLLKGKRGIITGALDENSIAWKVAEKAHAEGATFVLTNAPVAMRMGEIKILAENTKSEIVPADAVLLDDHAYFDYSFVTGEAKPVKAKLADIIYAGGRLIGQPVELIVEKKTSQS